MRRQVIDVLSAASGALAVAGGLLYALIDRAYVRYYDVFGLVLSDVGLSQGDIIRTAAVGVLYLSCLSAVLAGSVAAVIHVPSDKTGHPDRAAGDSKRRLTGTAVLIVLVLPPVVGLVVSDFVFEPPYVSYLIVAMAALLGAVLYSGQWQSSIWTLTTGSVLAWVMALAVVFICANFFLITRAERLAMDIVEDGRPSATTFMFELPRSLVCVSDHGRDRRFVYLGESDRGVVLFDPVDGRVHRPAERPDLVVVPRTPATNEEC